MSVLVVAEHDGTRLRPGSVAAVAFARETARARGDDVEILVAGCGVSEIAAEAAGWAPVISVDDDALAAPLADHHAAVIAHVARERGASLVTAAVSTFSRDVLPRVAVLLDAAMASDVVAHRWEGETLEVTRPMYAGAVTATVVLENRALVVTIRPTAWEPAAVLPALENVTTLEPPQSLFARRVVREGVESQTGNRPDVTEARIVVSGGRAIRNTDDYERLVGGLADALGGAAGSSRALVDAGITPNELQVGQTGKIVAPDLYVALGISGAVQHLAGMKNSRVIVAINKDPDAPIFDVADYGIVGDIYELVPRWIESLNA